MYSVRIVHLGTQIRKNGFVTNQKSLINRPNSRNGSDLISLIETDLLRCHGGSCVAATEAT